MDESYKNIIIGLLKKREDISSWLIITRKEKKYNKYYSKGGIDEDFLFGEKEITFLLIYRQFEKETGNATITLENGLSQKDIAKKIDDAVLIASLVKNQKYYPLENYQGYPEVIGHDEFFDEKEVLKYEKKIDSIKDSFIDELKKDKTIGLALLEIFLDDISSQITTSLGTTISQRRSECMLYPVLLSGDKEFVAMKTECRLADLQPKEYAASMIKIVKDAAESVKPKGYIGDVILSGDALLEFFCPSMHENPAVMHTFGRFKHMKVSKYELGKPICDFKGDKLTIISDPTINHGLRTLRYDSDTVPGKKMVIIDEGIFKNHITSKMYADYLKIKPSGPLGNIVVLPGSKSETEIYSGKKYEVVSFGWLNPNPFSGEFSAEIRLGYVIENGKKTPFKGGALTGNVFTMFGNAYYSKETIKKGYYFGPKAALFKGMTVASEE